MYLNTTIKKKTDIQTKYINFGCHLEITIKLYFFQDVALNSHPCLFQWWTATNHLNKSFLPQISLFSECCPSYHILNWKRMTFNVIFVFQKLFVMHYNNCNISPSLSFLYPLSYTPPCSLLNLWSLCSPSINSCCIHICIHTHTKPVKMVQCYFYMHVFRTDNFVSRGGHLTLDNQWYTLFTLKIS